MALEATFSLSPRTSYLHLADDKQARLSINGAYFSPKYGEGYRYSFDHQHGDDELYFGGFFAADPSLDYASWAYKRQVQYIWLKYDLSSFGANKELALVFGFDATSTSRVLIYTNSGLLEDVSLAVGDDQFLIQVESLDPLDLFFIPVQFDGSPYGGSWFFKGITGYVV